MITDLIGTLSEPPPDLFKPMARQLRSDLTELRGPLPEDAATEPPVVETAPPETPAADFDPGPETPAADFDLGTDTPTFDFDPGTDTPTSDFDLGTETPSSDFDPGTDTPSSDFDLGTDTPTSDFDPGTDTPTSDFDLGTDTPTSDFDLGTDTPTSDFDLGTDTPTSDFDLGTDTPSSDFDLGTDTPSSDFDLGTDTPSSDFDLGTDTPSSDFDASGFGEASATDDFAASADFAPTDDFAATADFAPTDDFAATADFAPTDDFAATADFAPTDDFAATADFAPTDDFAATADFAPTDDFAATADFAPTDDFAATADFAPTDDFAATGDFTTTDDFGGDFSTPETTASPDFTANDDFSGSDFLGDSDAAGGDFGSSMAADDLAAMADQARLNQGIGEEFTDEELANIRQSLLDYPPGIKKSVIDAIVNEKITAPDQRLLMNMVADSAEAATIADFLETRLGYRPEIAPSDIRKDGVRIIYADGQSPEELAARRRKARLVLAGVGAGVLGISLLLGGLTLYRYYSTRSLYERGLSELRLARDAEPVAREEHRKAAEELYKKALGSDGGEHNLEYLNKYGIAYMQAGYPDQAFVKLFGEVDPPYGREEPPRPELAWNVPGRRAPLIRMLEGSRWPSPEDWIYKEKQPRFTDQSRLERRLVTPGAYTVSRLRDEKLDHTTLISLGRFHSRTLTEQDRGTFPPLTTGNICSIPEAVTAQPRIDEYKNDGLGVDYYRLILTLMNRPDDVDAIAGIGDVYYRNDEHASAASEFNRILEKEPLDVGGHAGLLNTYIEIWRKQSDPRLVIARHRLVRQLGLEDELPIYTLAKLAAFYIDLEADDLRIKYQIDPVDVQSGMDIADNANYLIERIFLTEQSRDGETIKGDSYGEGFYQRGRFLMKRKEATRALKQFENAFRFDHRHYLAVNAMGEHYRRIHDYEKATEYFIEARRVYERFQRTYGLRPEDETLMSGDPALIFYNLGSLVYRSSAGIPEGAEGFPADRIYPDRSRGVETPEMLARRRDLRQAANCFQRALHENIKDTEAAAHIRYYLGWIDYTSSDFENALSHWEEMDPSYSYKDNHLVHGLANAYFYTGQLRSALGNYLKLKQEYTDRSLTIPNPDPDDARHRQTFLSLAAVLNNLGANYEKETYASRDPALRKQLEQESLKHYWSAIEAARRIGQDHEIARANVQLAFRSLEREPLLDDWVAPIMEDDSALTLSSFKRSPPDQ
ncbi:MAG: hypothetical protein HS115_03880 [Spirochaetales bacterium]|nr:hypothetical protein [Spirochaetales bacterium]